MMKRLMGGIGLALLATLVNAQPSSSGPETSLWQQIGFVATEVLIYTDQLQKLDQTACNHSPVSTFNTQNTRQELLQMVPEADRASLAMLLDSPMVLQLLQENSDGIQSMLGEQTVAGGELSDALRASCLELSLAFTENQRQAREELAQLVGAYREQ